MSEQKKRKGILAGLDLSWIFEMVFGSAQSFVAKFFAGISEGVEDLAQKLVRRGFVLSLVVFGLWFLFQGVAYFLSSFYGVPGSGEMIVGAAVLALAMGLTIFWKK